MKKKIIALCLIVALAATAVIGGTLAYFTDTDEATNVFTTGNVDISLTEPNWDAAKEEDTDHAKLIPGRTIAKDPTITVETTSERAYTFMKVTLSNDFMTLLGDYATLKNIDVNTTAGQKELIAKWFTTKVSPKIMSIDLSTNSVILGVLSPKNPGESVTYFDAITVPADIPNGMIKEGDNINYSIDITAYAIQAEGFEGKNADEFADRAAAYKALFNADPQF